MATTSPELTPGRRFELLRTLGVGSFGSVYLAEMESAGGFRRRVALKLLNPTWDQASDASTRLRDEARLLGRLQHRHIVRVDDLIRLEGRWALVMEYVEGVDLECVVAPPPGITLPALPARAALEVVIAVASALYAANESAGPDGRVLAVVHRDIKPSNIRVTPGGEVKVLDFGVARADFAGREAKTERVRYGSLGYMSPERLLGGDETPAGDVYALGVVLAELVLRQGYGRSELAENAQLAQVERAVAAVAALSSSSTGELLAEMLRYEPTERPSARTVEERARALLATLPEGDLARWSAVAVPKLDAAAGADDGAVRGRMLAESDLSGRAIVNSATIALPNDPEPPLPPSSSTISLLEAAPEPDVQAGGSRRAAWAIAAVTAVGIVFLGASLLREPAAAPKPSAPKPLPVATVVAPVAPTPPPVDAPIAVTPAAAPAVHSPGSSKPGPSVPAPIAAPEAPAPAPPEAAPAGDVLRSAKFVLDGGAPLTVRCGGVSGTGAGNVLLQSFPAGTCKVSSGELSTTVVVTEPRKVDCSLQEGALVCR